jgi:hypothetical protein
MNHINGAKIQSLSQMLMFSMERPKNSNNIAYMIPNEIDMCPHLSEEAKIFYRDQKVDYELIGTAMNFRNKSNGHFTSLVKDYTNNRWKQYND